MLANILWYLRSNAGFYIFKNIHVFYSLGQFLEHLNGFGFMDFMSQVRCKEYQSYKD